jgi:hypothetical protein
LGRNLVHPEPHDVHMSAEVDERDFGHRAIGTQC